MSETIVYNNKQKEQEQKELEQRKYFAKFLRMLKDVKDNNREFTDIQSFNEFVKKMIEENPYVNHSVKIDSIEVTKLNENERGNSNGHDKTIRISQNLINEVLDSLFQTIKTIGHEKSHVNQTDKVQELIQSGISDKADESQAELVAFYEDYKSQYLTPEAFDMIINSIGSRLGDVFDNYKNLTNEQKEFICKAAANSHYLNLLSEGLAERQGVDFSDHMLKSWIEDELVDDDVKDWLREQQIKLTESTVKNPFINHKKIPILEMVEKKLIEDMSQEEIVALLREVRSNGKNNLFKASKERTTEVKQSLTEATIVEDFMLRTLSRKATKETIESLVLTSLALGGKTFYNFKKCYDDRLDTTKDDITKLESSVNNAFRFGDLPFESYQNFYTNLDTASLYETIENLIDNGHLLKAQKLFEANSRSFEEASDNLNENIVKQKLSIARQNYIDNIKNNGKVSRFEYSQLGITDDEISELNNKNLINFMSDEEELEYFKNNNSKSFIPKVKEFQAIINMPESEKIEIIIEALNQDEQLQDDAMNEKINLMLSSLGMGNPDKNNTEDHEKQSDGDIKDKKDGQDVAKDNKEDKYDNYESSK